MASQPGSVRAVRKGGRRLAWAALAAAVALVAAVISALAVRPRSGTENKPVAAAPKPSSTGAVSSVGRIEPLQGVTRVAAPYVNGHPALVAELRVKEGQQVQRGQVLAILDGRAQLEAAMRQGEARIAQALSRIEQAKAGPKAGDLEAQRAAVARCRAAYDHSQSEYRRYESLYQKRDVSASEVDSKRAEMESDRHLQEEAEARLKSLSEIRPEDVRAVESELAVSRAELDRLRVELEATVVHAPSAGRVMHIRARAGEEAGAAGLLEIAQMDSIGVIAEVYETDLPRVRVGQKASISSALLPGTLQGTVAWVGSEIGRTELPAGDSAAFADSRVVNVRIRLQDNSAVAGMIHGKVTVVIEP